MLSPTLPRSSLDKTHHVRPTAKATSLRVLPPFLDLRSTLLFFIILQSPALLVDSEPQLWTAMVSSIKEETVFAGMNTVQVSRSHLKGERISYKKMPLFMSGAPHKKYRNSQSQK